LEEEVVVVILASTGNALQSGVGSGGGAFGTIESASVSGKGTPGQGNNGGRGLGSYFIGSGGGGAGEVGENATSTKAGRGGNGLSNNITNDTSYIYYAGGGGGVSYASIPTPYGVGGNGGGGDGGYNVAGKSGINGLGGGGGAGGGGGGNGLGDMVSGAGGSGIVIIRYSIKKVSTVSTFSTMFSTNVYQTENMIINSSSPGPALKVVQKYADCNVFEAFDDTTMAMVINKNGLNGINTETPLYHLDVNGIARSTYLIGNSKAVSNINFVDRKTSHLPEGSNLYYTSARTGNILYSSNQNLSNYMLNSSNNMSNISY